MKYQLVALALVACIQVATSEDLAVKEAQWKEQNVQQVRQAQDGAVERLQLNMITALNGLAQSAATRGANVTNAIAILTRAVATETISLAGVVAYMPRLLLLDMPTQFVEVLQLVRRNEVRIPSDVNSAIDTVTALARQAQTSGIPDQLFGPVTRVLPNLLFGVQTFLQTIIGNVFGFLGVRV